MADLADQIDDFICSFEGVGDLTMDTLAMFIFAWAVLALFLLWLCKFLYKKYVKKSDVSMTTTSALILGDAGKNGTIDVNGVDKLRKSEPRDILGKVNTKYKKVN